MMNQQNTTKEELFKELQELQQKYDSLKTAFEKALDDKEKEMLMLEKLSIASEDLIQFHNITHDYTKIVQIALDISGARYAAFNIFDANGLDFTTVAFVGNTKNLTKGLSILGFDSINKHWKHDPLRVEKIKHQTIQQFNSLHDLTGDILSESAVYLIEKTFRIGQVYVVKITKDNKVLGDFTLLFEKGKTLKNHKMVDLYAHQVGMFLDRNTIINSLRESEEHYKTLFENTGTAIITIDEDTTISLANEEFARRTGYLRSEVEKVKKWTEIVDKEDIQWMVAQHKLRRENPQYAIPVYEFRYRTKSGELRYALINVQLVPGTRKSMASMIDITDRKQIEKALVRSDELFELFFSQSYMGFYFMMIEEPFYWDATTDKEKTLDTVFANLKFTKVNKAFLNQYHATESDYIGKTLNDQFRGNLKHGKKVWRDFLDKGKKIRMETDETTIDGKPIHIEGDYICMYDEKGRIFGNFGVQLDVTSRKQAEAALKESEAKFKTLFEGANDAIFIMEKNVFIDCNQKTEIIFRCKKEDLVGHTVLEFSPPQQPDGQPSGIRALEKINAVLSGKPQFFEWRHLRIDGTLFDTEVSLSKVELKGVLYIQAIVRDITERKRAEDALRESETRFRIMADTAPVLIWLSGIDSMATYVNKPWLDFTGRTLEQELGNGWIGGIHPDDFQNCLDIYNSAFNTRSNYKMEYRLRHFDGEYRWLLENGVPRFTPDGIFVGYIGTNVDITEGKRAGTEIIQKNEQLIKLNAEKDKFFSIIAHDLRGPFSGFLKLTEFMVEGLSAMRQDDIQNIAEVMKKSATNLFNLIGNLLEWSRMQRGLTTCEPVLFKLMSKVNECMALVLEAANKKEITISYDIPEDLVVFSDINMFESIIRNLTSNAVKFTPKGGSITVSAVSISFKQTQISIRDNGIGMHKDILEKIFLLNENTGRKGTEGEPSTGLGLIICKDFVEKHGGEIWAESEAGKGSVFCFTIPNRAEPEGNYSITNSTAGD